MKADFQIANSEHCEILLGLMQEYYVFDKLELDKTLAKKALEQILSDENLGKIWLIKVDKKTAGYVVLTLGFSLEFGGRDAFIDELYLREEFRGQGIGKQVLQFVDEKCRELGIKALHLEVEHENKNAKTVYLRNGFDEHSRFLMTKRIEL